MTTGPPLGVPKLALVVGTFAIAWEWITAASVVVRVPLIVLVLLVQRRINSGLTRGAIR